MLELRFVGVDEWLARASYQFSCDLPAFSVTDGSGRLVQIRPFVALCRDIVLVGGDWIPVYGDGVALLDQMVHVPTRYLHKAFNIKEQGGQYALTCPVETIEDDVVLVGGHNAFYHWMFDSVPRLILARDAVGMRKLVINEAPAAFELETLETLGYAESQLLTVPNDRAIRARTAVTPSLLASTTVPHKALPDLVKSALPQTRASAYERVYISRADTSIRNFSNEDALVALIERYGFQRCILGRMSLEAQRNLFYGAKAVIAAHGAGMANLLFSARGTDVLEITLPEWPATYFAVLSRFCGFRHEFLPARLVAVREDGNASLGTWEADLDALEGALKRRFG